jgi:putative phosphoesterase
MRIAQAQASAEVFIHLGDGERDFAPVREKYTDKLVRSVRGNSDFGSLSPLMDTLVVERRRIMFTHGHTLNVRQSTELLLEEARRTESDIVLFGHTHVALSDRLFIPGHSNEVYLLNPGSCSQPRSGQPSYGLLDITDNGIIARIVVL